MLKFIKKKNQYEKFFIDLLNFLSDEIKYSFQERDFDSFDSFKEKFDRSLYAFLIIEKFCMSRIGSTSKIQSMLHELSNGFELRIAKELKYDERQRIYTTLIKFDDFTLNNDSINEERIKVLKWLVDEELKFKVSNFVELSSLSQQKSLGCNLNFYLTDRQIATFQRTLKCVNHGNIGEAYHQLCDFIDNYGFNKFERLSVFEILSIRIMSDAIISYIDKA